MIRLSLKTMTRYVQYFLLVFILMFILFWWISGESNDLSPSLRSLKEDGFIVFRDFTSSSPKQDDIDKPRILEHLPDGYTFLDYKYVIRGCSLSTFHRDVTSSPYIYETRHPIYTYIEYVVPPTIDRDIPLLTVCPTSHKTTPFVYSAPVVIRGEKGKTGILFHCDLLHAGAINELGQFRYAEQYKVAHIEDLDKLSHLQKIRMEKNGKCDISPIYEHISRRISWIFSHIFNHHFTSYLQTRPDTHVGKMLLSLYGREFYNGGGGT